jgi:hypothetical protein
LTGSIDEYATRVYSHHHCGNDFFGRILRPSLDDSAWIARARRARPKIFRTE